MKKPIIEWVFYYQLTEYSKKIVVLQKEYKAPKRTNIWKELNRMLNHNECKVIGYCFPKDII